LFFLQGSIKVIESAQFGISVNVTTSNTYDLASVKVQYVAVGQDIIMQLVSAILHRHTESNIGAIL